jgi:hypothetical protein
MTDIEHSVADELLDFAAYCRDVEAEAAEPKRTIWRERGDWAASLAQRAAREGRVVTGHDSDR